MLPSQVLEEDPIWVEKMNAVLIVDNQAAEIAQRKQRSRNRG